MHRRSQTQTSSLIVFLSIISILLQFTFYYFFESFYLTFALSSFVIIISTHILLEQSLIYEVCFIYTFLTLFISLIITIFTFYGQDQSIIPYSIFLYAIVSINWFLPTLYCFIRCMYDHGGRFHGFNTFYRNNSLIFLLFYFVFLAYSSFYPEAFPWAFRASAQSANFVPFMSLAAQIEDAIYGHTTTITIINYVLVRILIFIPYGYYITILLRRNSRLIRILSLLLLPIVIEIFQYFYINHRTDIDDILYAFIGGFIGFGLFYLINHIYRSINGKNFLSKSSDYRYSNLHF